MLDIIKPIIAVFQALGADSARIVMLDTPVDTAQEACAVGGCWPKASASSW